MGQPGPMMALKIKTMALILPVNGIEPVMGGNCSLAPNCTVMGDVIMGMIAVYGSMLWCVAT